MSTFADLATLLMAFFVLLVFAALSSAISLLEVVVAFLVDTLGVGRKLASIGVGGAIWLLGLWSAVDASKLDLFDQITTNSMLPLGGFGIAVAAGWLLAKEDRESGFLAFAGDLGPLLAKGWTLTIRYVTPVLVLLVIAYKAKFFELGGA